MPSSTDARQIGPVPRGTTEENQSRAEVVGTGTDCSDCIDPTDRTDCSDRFDGTDPGRSLDSPAHTPGAEGRAAGAEHTSCLIEAPRVFQSDGPSRDQPLARNWVLQDALSGAGKGLVH